MRMRGYPSSLASPLGFFPNQGHQLSRVLLGHAQFGVDHGTAAGLGNKPLPALDILQGNGFFRADMKQTPQPSQDMGSTFRFEMAEKRQTSRTFCTRRTAPGRYGDLGSHKRFPALDPGLQQEVQVGGVHVGVHDHRPLGQSGQRGQEGRLAGSAFSADHRKLLHGFSSSQLPSQEWGWKMIWCWALIFWYSSSVFTTPSRNRSFLNR